MGYRSGRVSCDGNGMVGGYWWARDFTAEAKVWKGDILDRLETVADCVPEEFTVQASFEAGEDTSVGVSQYCEMQDVGTVSDDVIAAIDAANISDAWKEALKAVLEAYAEELDPEDYDMDDITDD